jgi:hypothetical protein
MILHSTVTEYQQLCRKIIASILAASGIMIDHITPLRLLTIVLILCNIILTYIFQASITLHFAVVYFIVLFTIRYIILFTSFGEGGLAQKMTFYFGEKKAYAYYEAVTGFLFFYRSTSFNLLVVQTAHSWAVFDLYQNTFIILAWIMIFVATVVNVWGTMIIGIDVYYYKDMFVQKPIGSFEVKGPFRYFSNPMYSIGQFNAYGLALLSGSTWGLLAAALNQVVMYVFYYACEKPHIERLFGSKCHK